MGLAGVPILSMLRTRLDWAQARQRVLAENVANADTPNFRPHDLVPPQFNGPNAMAAPTVVNVGLATTEPGHLGGLGDAQAGFKSTNGASYSVRPTGNAVNLEEEMMKVAANQMDYQAATALYTRSLNLLKIALGKA